jgi:hypothetical protein
MEQEVHCLVCAISEARISATKCAPALQPQASAKAPQAIITAVVWVLQSSKAEEAVVWKCPIPQCREDYHRLRNCRHFRSLTAVERRSLIVRLKLCLVCLTMGHGTEAKNCPYENNMGELCKNKVCEHKHHWMLHIDPMKHAQEVIQENSTGSGGNSGHH